MERLAGAIVVLLISSVLAGIRVEAAGIADTVRALAENVLGSGVVRSLSLADKGATVLMRWESATYKAGNKQETIRELMYAEAQLATGSIMGRLNDVARIRFSILWKEQMMATGENVRGRGVSMAFAPALGGGTYAPPEPKGGSKTGGTAAAKD